MSTAGPELPGLDDLFDADRREGPAEQLRALRDVLVRLPMLGAFNASLVHAQLPGAHYVATRAQWRRDFAREVRPGARPLVVLRPYAPVDFVFDVSQTDGRPLPEGILAPFRVRGPVTADGVAWFESLLPRRGIAVAAAPVSGSETATDPGAGGAPDPDASGALDPDTSEAMDGQARLLDPPETAEIAPGRIVEQRHVIVLDAALAPATRLATLFRELGHVLCEHLPHPADAAGGRSRRRDLTGVGEAQRALEAECTAWLLCERLGLAVPAGEHLSALLADDADAPPFSVHAVVRAVNSIESWARGLETLARRVASDPAPDDQVDAHPEQGAFDLEGLRGEGTADDADVADDEDAAGDECGGRRGRPGRGERPHGMTG